VQRLQSSEVHGSYLFAVLRRDGCRGTAQERGSASGPMQTQGYPPLVSADPFPFNVSLLTLVDLLTPACLACFEIAAKAVNRYLRICVSAYLASGTNDASSSPKQRGRTVMQLDGRICSKFHLMMLAASRFSFALPSPFGVLFCDSFVHACTPHSNSVAAYGRRSSLVSATGVFPSHSIGGGLRLGRVQPAGF
jgi:hypothetical protein